MLGSVRHPVTDAWSIELPDDGTGAITDDGNLVVTSPGRTVVVSPWDAAPGTTPQQAYARLRAEDRPAPAEEHAGEGPDGTVWWAFLVDEDDDGHRYLGLYGYVLAPDEWLQVAVLVDDPADHDWALDTWRSVRHEAAHR